MGLISWPQGITAGVVVMMIVDVIEVRSEDAR